jgi:hypothetical protein
MCVELNRNNSEDEREVVEFERKLRFAMQHSEAPIGLKQRVLARARNSASARRQTQQGRGWILQRIAASALLASVFGGYAVYRQHEERVTERIRGEEARQQVMTALRITSRVLSRAADRVNEPLAESSR